MVHLFLVLVLAYKSQNVHTNSTSDVKRSQKYIYKVNSTPATLFSTKPF